MKEIDLIFRESIFFHSVHFFNKKQLNYGYCSKTFVRPVISLHVALVDLASHYIHRAFKCLNTSVPVVISSSISFCNLYYPTITYSQLTVSLRA